ncbi:hypothetical protein H2204_006435 [Knufia peltigerae]|uniref:Uncharacterized protein n=1 Tax=Knufia peltigerae TaxID=1002370 RepID=A0AA39CYR9_9EURO|nr:hypothetical protein H2204_006435 [Knufia peltigerae]
MGSQKKKTESKKGKGKGNDSTGPLTPREVELLRRIMASTNASSSSRAVVPLDYAELGKSYPGVNARTLHQQVRRLRKKTQRMGIDFKGVGRGKGPRRGKKAQQKKNEKEEEEEDDDDETDDDDVGSADPGCKTKQPKGDDDDDDDDNGPTGKKGGGSGGDGGCALAMPVVVATA